MRPRVRAGKIRLIRRPGRRPLLDRKSRDFARWLLLAAAILAFAWALLLFATGGFVWEKITVQFGIKQDAISAVDSGHRRHASDHAKLDGIGNTRMKEAILKKRPPTGWPRPEKPPKKKGKG